MDSFTVWTLRRLSEKQEKSRLSKVSNLIDWMPIRQILDEMYDNKSEMGGRPNCDVILMFKILITSTVVWLERSGGRATNS